MKRIKFEDGHGNRNNHERAVCHKFWNEAPEDLLTEIFIRLPDCRSAVRTSTVCRRWHSLIRRDPQFVQRFKSHHHHEIFPWTMMLRKLELYEYPVPGPEHARTLCQLYADEWMFLHGKLPDNCLDFLPSPMMIRAASCSGLLLVSPGLTCADDLYICNPVTKQFAQLPAIPRLEDSSVYDCEVTRCALVPMPPSGATTNSRFKVVEVLTYYKDPVLTDRCVVPVSIFCSESRKWEIRNFRCLGPSAMWCNSISSDIITCNEILYWLGITDKERLVYLDLLKEKCGAIDIPFSGDQSFTHRIGIVHAGDGVQELRLIQILPLHKSKMIHLRLWRLNSNNHNNNNDEHDDDESNWFLVHDKKLKTPKYFREAEPLVGPFLHPGNGDFLFVVWGKSVIEYNLTDATPKKIVKLLENAYWLENAYRFGVTPFVMVLSSTASNLANSYL